SDNGGSLSATMPGSLYATMWVTICENLHPVDELVVHLGAGVRGQGFVADEAQVESFRELINSGGG
ncbi:MAG: hypothetical protein JXI43_10025, partial [Tissierellales bacterium]|nr:hypothetical protein [Tissierellales bacterium]